MKIYTEEDNFVTLQSVLGYETDTELAIARGLQKDYDSGDKPSPSDKVKENSEGTMLHNELHHSNFKASMVSKITALTLEPIEGSIYGNTPYMDVDFQKIDYATRYSKFSDLCEIRTGNDSLSARRDLEYYPEDFLYSPYCGYPLNHMITLRRFPYPTIDNIADPIVQKEQDISRMVTFFDNETNTLSDILQLSYKMNWKELKAGYERMQMVSGDQEGLSGFMKKTALIFGDKELIKNRLRGPHGNQIGPTDDENKAHGPVDSIASTTIRDVGLDFEKEFSLKFVYTSKSFGGRNPDAAMKDILANVLLMTYNDGSFWPGARYWVGARPSKATNMFRFTSSDNFDEIMDKGLSTLKTLVMQKFGSPQSALQTLKDILKGGVQMAMAGILNKVGRAGVPFSNSLLSGAPTGDWHITVGHPLNPIMVCGNLICTNTEINFPDNTLSYGDFPTKIEVIVKLKTAMPKDRAGIETMFNYGRKRLYMPIVVSVEKNNKKVNSPYRSYLKWTDTFIDKTITFVENGVEKTKDIILTSKPSIDASVAAAAKYVKDVDRNSGKSKINESMIWVKNKAGGAKDTLTNLVKDAGEVTTTAAINVSNKTTVAAKKVKDVTTGKVQQASTASSGSKAVKVVKDAASAVKSKIS